MWRHCYLKRPCDRSWVAVTHAKGSGNVFTILDKMFSGPLYGESGGELYSHIKGA